MSLTQEQVMARNLDLAEKHLSRILRTSELLEHIPEGAYVVLLPPDDPELFEANLAMANRLARTMSQNGPEEPVFLVLLPVGSENALPDER